MQAAGRCVRMARDESTAPQRCADGAKQRGERMKADKIVKANVKKIRKAVGAELSDKDLEMITMILSDMAVELISGTADRCTKKVMQMYPPRTDLAHAITDDVKRAQTALVANLQSMR